jgi:serine kinase of HPr protein (carbohydrate metabolism regulator)
MKNNENSTIIHATSVAIAGKGVIFMGPSGSGKSDLALRLIDQGAKLICDDYTQVTVEDEELLATQAPNISGLLEVRGAGLLNLPFASNVPLKLAVNLVQRDKIERLPEPQFFDCLGQKLPLLSLHSFDPSTPAKIRLVLSQI